MVEKKVNSIDGLNDVELLSELIGFFGASRTVQLVGWAVVAGVAAGAIGTQNPAELRRVLEERGYGTSPFYAALRDLRRFGEYIENRPYPAQDHRPTMLILERVGKLQPT